MAVTFAVLTFVLALFVSAFLIFCAIFYIIAFEDLKADIKGPIEQAESVNSILFLEYILHGFINFLFLLAGNWTTLLVNVPLLAHHLYRFLRRPVKPGLEIYDPTTIMNQAVIKYGLIEAWIKLPVYFVFFFGYMFAMVMTYLETFSE